MSLIKVKEIGYGLKGDTLSMVIAIPENSYLKEFWVCNQKDAANADCTVRGLGIEYIKAVQTANLPDEISVQEAFLLMFKKIGSEEDAGNTYDVYSLRPDFQWCVEIPHLKSGIKISNEDLTLVTMHLEAGSSKNFDYPTECGQDGSVLTVPLCDLLPIKLGLLDMVSALENPCDLPREFIDKLLQLRAIELALCCKKFCKAMEYWDKFFGEGLKKKHKKCGCHG